MDNPRPTMLYFIRHGETASNKNRIRQGIQIDDYLNPQGVRQIEKLSKFIKFLNLDVLFTSHLRRAEQTAELIDQTLPKPVKILRDSRLRERDFGSLSGKTKEEWDKLLPNHRELEGLQVYDYRAFGGESVEDVRQRALSAILDIAENYANQNVGIITHNGVIRLLLFHFPEIPRVYRDEAIQNKDIANADIYEWEITPEAIANLKSLVK